MKALNNFVAGTGFIAVSEAVLVGEKFGLDPPMMVDVMNASTGKNFNTENVVEAARDLAPVRLRLRARPARQGREDRRRPRGRRSTWKAHSSRLSAALLGEARDQVGSEKDHTLAYTYWESRDKKAAAE